jgi:hypothetical protein
MHTIDNAYVLFDEFEDFGQDQGRTRTRINPNLSFVDQAGVRVVFQWQEPLFRFSLSDALSLRYAAVQLRMGNLATQEEIAQAFQHSVATQRRWETRFQSHGLDGLKRGKSTGRPAAIPRTLDGALKKWFEEGVPNCEMAKRLQVAEATIHRALTRLGLQRQNATTELAWPTDAEEELQQANGKESRDASPVEAKEKEPPAAEAKPLESGQSEEKQSVETTEPESMERVPETAESWECDFCGSIQQESGASDGGEPTDAATVVEAPAAVVEAAAEACLERQPVFGELLEDVLAELEEKGFSIDRDADDRCGDRALARLGRLDDATPLFADRPGVRQAGVLLTVPLLVRSRLLDVFLAVYHSLGPAFYGLRTTVLVLFVAALLRIKRPEHFKEHNPRELGHLLGLDRAPEVKTVRRKLAELAARRRALEVMMEMAKQRLREDPERVAFLYVDGHVRIYHGKYVLAKTKKPQHQVAKPAATDHWVHDARGEPLLVVTSEMNESLTQMLEPIMQDVKRLVGERRVTVIFDRGGYSPKLFARLGKQGFDVMTYRKGKVSAWPKSWFADTELEVDGRRYCYRLAERNRVRIARLRAKGKDASSQAGPQFLWMREVRVLRADGRQTAILTSNKSLDTVLVPYRQFNRWRQENFFKYMQAEFELDGLLEYGAEEVSPGRDRPNPARRPLERELAAARTRVQCLQAQLGSPLAPGGGPSQRTVRGFKIAHAKLRAEIAEAEAEVARLREELEALPRRIPASEVETLKTERKLIGDTIKITAYQVETDLLGLLAAHYSRSEDEGRTLLQAAFQSTARIEVRAHELHVELAPQSSPHRTQAIAALCDQLNAWDTKFPGTHLRLRLGIQPHEPLTNA